MTELHNGNPKGLGVAIVVAGAAACCALPLLIAAGVLGGLAGWFADGGWTWIAGGAILAAVAFLLARRRPGTPARRAGRAAPGSRGVEDRGTPDG